MKYFIFITLSFLFSICKAQIIPDGKTDNTDAIINIAKGGDIVYLPSGVTNCRRTALWDTFATSKELLSLPVQLRLGFQNAKYRAPLVIKGCPGAVLNFTDTDTNSTAIMLTSQGRGSNRRYTEISDVIIRGKGYGIAGYGVNDLYLNNVRFVGFKEALVLNNCYGFQFNNLRFDSCGRAAYLTQCHGGLVNNTWLYQCNTGFELNSNNIVFNFYYANYCGTGLVIRAGNNEFHSASFESNKPAEAQIIIGNDAGPVISGNLFSSLLIVANPNSKAGIWFKKTAGNVYIYGDNNVFIKPRVDSGSTYKIIKS